MPYVWKIDKPLPIPKEVFLLLFLTEEFPRSPSLSFTVVFTLIYYYPLAKLENREYCPWKASFTVPSGPFLCFCTITSVIFLSGVSGS